MDTHPEPGIESPGAQLTAMLAGQRVFLENVFSLMRFLEAELTKRGWDLIRNGGYAVTRNGSGHGLTSFASADWVVTQAGIAFVRSGVSELATGRTATQIPAVGQLELLAFQVRWLDKAPGEPVVWRANLAVESPPDKPARKWEEYQSSVFDRMMPDVGEGTGSSGLIRPIRFTGGGESVVVTGDFVAVPVASIASQQDVISLLIDLQQG
jgi:hypothetical protein